MADKALRFFQNEAAKKFQRLLPYEVREAINGLRQGKVENFAVLNSKSSFEQPVILRELKMAGVTEEEFANWRTQYEARW